MMTSIGTSWSISEKVLEVTSLSIEIWKTRYMKYINSRRQRVNNKVPDYNFIGLRYFLKNFLEGQVVLKNWAFIKTLLHTLKSDIGEHYILVDLINADGL